MRLLLFLVVLMVSVACSDDRIPIPKPRVYPKVTYPERNYVQFDKNYCAFSFTFPDYMKFERDSMLVNQKAKHPCWFTMKIPSLDGSIHFTYTDIGGDAVDQKLYDVLSDSYTLSEKHNIKATGRTTEDFIDRERKLYAITFSVDGDVASPYHFRLTDSLNHAVWASLYFNTRPNADSMAPVVAFVKEDLEKMIESFEWNEYSKTTPIEKD